MAGFFTRSLIGLSAPIEAARSAVEPAEPASEPNEE